MKYTVAEASCQVCGSLEWEETRTVTIRTSLNVDNDGESDVASIKVMYEEEVDQMGDREVLCAHCGAEPNEELREWFVTQGSRGQS